MFPGYHPLQVRRDMAKAALHMPFAVPIAKLRYMADGGELCTVCVYPTLQFLYSHHVCPEYVTREVRELLAAFKELGDPKEHCRRFLLATQRAQGGDTQGKDGAAEQPVGGVAGGAAIGLKVVVNHVRQAPQYLLATL